MPEPKWNQITHFAALDWAMKEHQLIVLDAAGEIVEDFVFTHEPEGWRKLRQRLCRDQITLIDQRTALVCQLLATLRDYYPAAADARPHSERYRLTTRAMAQAHLAGYVVGATLRNGSWMSVAALTARLRERVGI